MDLAPEFYDLNEHQHFMFPHNDCDRYTNGQLEAMVFAPHHLVECLTEYLKSALTPDNLRATPEFVLLIISYLRLKFMLEMMDPPRIEARLMMIPVALRNVGPWMEEGVLDEQYWTLDCMTTAVFNAIIRWVKGENIQLTSRGFSAFTEMNHAMQTIRPGGSFGNAHLFDLAHKPFLNAWRNMESLVLSPLIIRWNAGAFVFCPSVPEHTALPAQ